MRGYNFAWQSGYGAFTVSQSHMERVRSYVEDQKTRHRRTTFEEEFVSLLRLHHITFGPQHYLWA